MNKTKTKRLELKRARALNNIIHQRNLYLRDAKRSIRVYYSRVVDGAVVVESVATGELFEVDKITGLGFAFYDGNGYAVDFDGEGVAI